MLIYVKRIFDEKLFIMSYFILHLFYKSNVMKTKLFFFSLLVCTISVFSQTTYYCSAAGSVSLNTLANWSTNTNGIGVPHPANFTTANCTYVITNTATATITGAWTISGAGSVIQVGDGTQTVNFTIPVTVADKVTGTVNVMNHGTLTINNATNPTLGTLSSGSTVVYSGASGQTVLDASYYNVTIAGAGTKALANIASSSVANALTINSGVSLQLNTNTAYTLTLNGTVAGTGTFKGGASSNLSIAGTGAFGTLLASANPLTLANLSINRSSLGSITLGNNVTVNTSCSFTNGKLSGSASGATAWRGSAQSAATDRALRPRSACR